MDARAHLNTLVGKSIHAIGQGRPNRIVTLDGADVVVATTQSPNGQRIAIAEVHAAMDMLERAGDLLIDKKIVGYRSAFIGAVARDAARGRRVHSATARQTRTPLSDSGRDEQRPP